MICTSAQICYKPICLSFLVNGESNKLAACLISVLIGRLKQKLLGSKKERGDHLQRVKLKIRL